MIVRIVKLSFKPEAIQGFLSLFEDYKMKIRGFEGCQFLELYQDKKQDNIFFTYSYWDDQEALDRYRHSEIFKLIWPATKAGFNAKPEAWSLNKLYTLD
ncbi:putative quinol monooxygenase [Mesonia sp. HuA40]|uniref:putative quinol monooxygenase n=1 Tax=Mesonia sp. HuA40 TaxID=2602761 RepID=UPI0011C6F4D4|nr:antibiotic biosynthesis monooxygenase family protein [Mesonia sp. HuA40]TXK75186.1 antibiotic biosynthesis monooxygenase [Mesonia sp. HuA40]